MAKYDPVFRFLRDSGLESLDLAMDDLADMVDGGLPPSAYDPGRRMWWSNSDDPRHVQAAAWLAAGYAVAPGGVDYALRRVRFTRGRQPGT
ncbi:MAG TPA: hypothetical protein VFQ68_39710 [Streptosporangiaceae bacterium]|nr:hypothetical protein [Streptosporangiaceae bacterium]